MWLRTISYRFSLLLYRGLHLSQRIARGVLRRASSAWRSRRPGRPIHDQLVLSAARKAHFSVDELPYGFLRISDGKRVVYSKDFNFSFESLTAYWLCGDKHLTSLLLQRAGVPVPAFAVFHANDIRSACSAFHALKPPLVVKPCLGAHGNGVTVGVETLKQLRRACCRAAVMADRIVLEQLVTGRHWRITLFDGQLVFACERLAASVIGDGLSSIRTLVNQRNKLIVERDGLPSAYPIRIDADARTALRDQHLIPDSVPAPGRKIVLKRICNAAVGGMTVDVTGNLHGDYLRMARKAAETMGARLAGVDVIAPDVTRPIGDSPVFINEVNTTPDLSLNHFDISGCGDAMATVDRLLAMVFAAERQSAADGSREGVTTQATRADKSNTLAASQA
jgi:cyanophycin synthetase